AAATSLETRLSVVSGVHTSTDTHNGNKKHSKHEQAILVDRGGVLHTLARMIHCAPGTSRPKKKIFKGKKVGGVRRTVRKRHHVITPGRRARRGQWLGKRNLERENNSSVEADAALETAGEAVLEVEEGPRETAFEDHVANVQHKLLNESEDDFVLACSIPLPIDTDEFLDKEDLTLTVSSPLPADNPADFPETNPPRDVLEITQNDGVLSGLLATALATSDQTNDISLLHAIKIAVGAQPEQQEPHVPDVPPEPVALETQTDRDLAIAVSTPDTAHDSPQDLTDEQYLWLAIRKELPVDKPDDFLEPLPRIPEVKDVTSITEDQDLTAKVSEDEDALELAVSTPLPPDTADDFPHPHTINPDVVDPDRQEQQLQQHIPSIGSRLGPKTGT
ncbi:hypothetical protein HK102_005746, partial [Quaeritorhiza haematococci]